MNKAWLEAGFRSEQVDLDGRKLASQRVATEPPAERRCECEIRIGASRKLSLFGWLRGTVASTGDLTEPADPEWARRIDQ